MAAAFDPDQAIKKLRWLAQAALVDPGQADIDGIRQAIKYLQRAVEIDTLRKRKNAKFKK